MEKEKHEHRKEGELNYDYITGGMFLGTNQCCATGLSDVLKKEGITVDISLEEHKLDQPFGVEAYLWIPVEDETPPTFDQLDFGVIALEEFVRQGKKVYIHCKNGHGRSTTLLTAYLIKQGKTFEEAKLLIKEKRPVIHFSKAQTQALQDYSQGIVK